MQTGPLQGATSLPPSYDAVPAPPPTDVKTGFGSLLDRALGYVNGQQKAADQSVLDLAAGRVTDLHQVTLAVSKADLTLRLFLEIRNRLTEAYQEIMRMQV